MSFKFNNGTGAVVCDNCGIIIKTGISPIVYETQRIKNGPDLCEKCKKENDISGKS